MKIFLIYDPVGGGEIAASSDFLGLYRDKQIVTDGDGNIYYLLYFPSTMEILSRYDIAWPAGTPAKNYWPLQVGVSEIAAIANDIVRWNCTADIHGVMLLTR
mgnify:FL=1